MVDNDFVQTDGGVMIASFNYYQSFALPPVTKSKFKKLTATACHHCGKTLTIEHMLLECAVLQECRDKYYTVDSLNALFETISETFIVKFLREARF